MDLFKSREETIINFDQNYKSYLDSIDRDINKTLHLYSYLILKEPNYYLNEKAEYLILVIRSIDYLISATFLVRQRAIFEAGNIIRLCMETSAMAIHINDNTKEFIHYKQGNYKSTMAINFAERHIKKFGEIWGVLSKLMVHPNTFHGISSIMERETLYEEGNVNLGFKPQNSQQDKLMLLLLRLTANIIFKCFEVIISKKDKFKGIEGLFLEEANVFLSGKSTDIIIEELLDEFINCHT